MAPPSRFSIIPLYFLLSFIFFSVVVQSQVPKNNTFQILNQGEFGEYIIEYDASYRIIRTDEVSFYTYPFRLCFYNTTPNAHIFAIRAGIPNDEDLMRWVWDANRNDPVRENATLTFGRDGNLVLADVDGRIVWQTNTANKGVTGISMQPNGNLVLHDKRGRFIWQSFDYPADTLLVGQSLRNNGRNKLISRTSDVNGRDGPYSIVMDKKGFTMYVNNSGKLLQYGGWGGEGLLNLTFDAVPEDQSITAYELVLAFTQLQSNPPTSRHLLQSRPVSNSRGIILKKLNYNATYSFLRLESDGNLKIFTYYTNTTYLKWAETYAFFGDDVRECGLPSKCGSFGFCDKKMCIACPSPKGLLGWSESCKAPTLAACKSGGAATAAKYYKIVGVEHFMSPYDEGEGPMKVNDCRDKCSKDCKCVGFFYKEESSKCLRVPLLGTLIKDVNASHVGFIKYLK
ncbi:Bulb-type lectin domain [Macleaya cordata]|uniref:Bulb-type lectin domain n=1 Tax=Macleaya cordata TaxID=56857 RepID=A0A200QWI7_MACCD|nr:Bulb-type lectin domain [Macleaya cordata]